MTALAIPVQDCGDVMMESTVTRMATATMLARELEVTVNQIGMWHTRRSRNGFPECLGRMEIGEGRSYRREARVWDLDAVLAWKRSYVPDKGGRQPG